jgi:hypothetical protein
MYNNREETQVQCKRIEVKLPIQRSNSVHVNADWI